MSQQEIADRIGLSVKGWAKNELDKAIPSGDTLLRLEAIGYNPGWILSGRGAKKMDTVLAQHEADLEPQGDKQAKTPFNAFDDWTMRRIAAIVTSIHHEQNVPISPENVAVEAALLYNELAARASDLADRDEVEATLPQLRYLLKKRLEEANVEPGTGKHSA